jgi:hypothetical protein
MLELPSAHVPNVAVYSVPEATATAVQQLAQDNAGLLETSAVMSLSQVQPVNVIAYGTAAGKGTLRCELELPVLQSSQPGGWEVVNIGSKWESHPDGSSKLTYHPNAIPPQTRELTTQLSGKPDAWRKLAGETTVEIAADQLPPAGKFRLVRARKIESTGKWELVLLGTR